MNQPQAYMCHFHPEPPPPPPFSPYSGFGCPASDIKLPAAAAKSLQPCPTLCDPIDGRPSGSSVPGIL